MTQPDFASALASANSVLRAGGLAEAETAFAALAELEPSRPEPRFGLAMTAFERRDLALARDRWADLIARWPAHQPVGAGMRYGWTLLRLQLPREADATFADLHQRFPHDARPLVGRARCAIAAHRWTDAVAHWEAAIARGAELNSDERLAYARNLRRVGRISDAVVCWEVAVSNGAKVNFAERLAHARDLRRLGRNLDALSEYRALVAEAPDRADLQFGFVSLLTEAGESSEALAASKAAVTRAPRNAKLAIQAAGLAGPTLDWRFAQEMTQSAITEAATAADLKSAMGLANRCFCDWDRAKAWMDCLQRLRDLPTPGEAPERAQHLETAMRLHLALRDFPRFMELADETRADREIAGLMESDPSSPLWRLFRLQDRWRSEIIHDTSAEKVFGIGMAKTGTTSLDVALDRMGYFTAHWENEFTGDLLSLADAFLFDALTDSVVGRMMEQLYYTFPNSRFVYTTRTFDDWAESLIAHEVRNHDPSYSFFYQGERRPYLVRKGVFDQHGLTSTADHAERVAILAAFRASWESRIFNFFDAHDRSRLLVLDIFDGQGWQELGDFLERPTPAEPFPRENERPAAETTPS
jgi:tetratricopeptide (TPR) repeat protein